MVILFTGMSGIGIKTSLKNYINVHKHHSMGLSKEKPVFISVEEEIEAAFFNLNKSKPRSKSAWLNLILTESYPNLERFWKIAVDNVIKQVNEYYKKVPDRLIFINLHVAYYHNKTQEYFSLVFIKKLQTLKPKMIVTLIDDIYEIHERLTSPGCIYHDSPNPICIELITRYHCLLNWRAKEIMMSRFIANQLGCKNFVLAVKHSYGTLSKLIEGKPRMYLSHPISEVRRLEKAKKYPTAKKIRDEITSISEELSEEFTVFLPTTIDEFRIYGEKVKSPSGEVLEEKYQLHPLLTKRWDSEFYNKPESLLYLKSGFADNNNLWQKELEEKSAHHEVLKNLADLISDQVTTRDYTLVEQSDAIVIYRPIFNGNASGGVKEEHNYFMKLKEDLKTKSHCFIYCPAVDINLYMVREFEARLQNEICETKTLSVPPRKQFKNLSPHEISTLIKAKMNQSLVLDVLNEVIDNHDITINVQDSKSPLGKNKILIFKEEFVNEFLRSLSVVSDYETNATLFCSDSITIEDFVKRICKYYSK